MKTNFKFLPAKNKEYNTGKHRWNHGTPIRFDSWDRSPSHRLKGPCPTCGTPTSNYGAGYTCHNDYCSHSANNFVCNAGPIPDWWNTQINVFLDGNMWCATEDNFTNLQESPSGFGETPQKAD